MSLSTRETNLRYLAAVKKDAGGDPAQALSDLRALVSQAHPDLAEVVLLLLMKIAARLGDRAGAFDAARQILAIDPDPPPSVRKILASDAGSRPLPEPSEPDYVSERPGEHMEFETGEAPTHFYAGKRRFDVEYREEANGVHYASAEVTRAKNGVLYDPNHAPFDAVPNDCWTEETEGPTPAEAFEALKSKIEE